MAPTNVAPDASSKSPQVESKPISKPPPPRKKRPNYALIHSKPLPLNIHPLPFFHPSNPISFLRYVYTWLSHLISAPSSHPPQLYIGYFSPETRSVHVTDPEHIRALWEMGFFGKGTLSRSEPSWLDRETAKLARERGLGPGGKAAEDATRARREERRLFKLERARLERERIERQRRVEEGLEIEAETTEQAERVSNETENATLRNLPDHDKPATDRDSFATDAGRVRDVEILAATSTQAEIAAEQAAAAVKEGLAAADIPPQTTTTNTTTTTSPPTIDIENQEHLQLTLEEAFFLSYALGVLSIHPPPASSPSSASPTKPYQPRDLLPLFASSHVFTPTPTPATSTLQPPPNAPFLLAYATYHHYRSLGWVVRSGVKFGVDFLLYNRGPVFAHAEFAVVVLPAYTDAFWETEEGRGMRGLEAGQSSEKRDWWWLHCVNRVQSQVRKSLVVAYVDVPPPSPARWEGEKGEVESGVGRLLRGYKVREFVMRRWVGNRMRD